MVTASSATAEPFLRGSALAVALAGWTILDRLAVRLAPSKANLSHTRGAAQAQASIPALVDQRLGLDPRHHGAQLFADLLDRMLGELGAHRLERGLVDLVRQHPIAGEAARLDVVEDALHLRARLLVDHARAADVFAVFRG